MILRLYVASTMFVIVTNFTQGALAPAIQHLIELCVCRTYYLTNDPTVVGPSGDVTESLCKIDAIQMKVAYLLGVLETLRAISCW
jgi:hypothetical protein